MYIYICIERETCVYIYIYMRTQVCVYIYIYIHTHMYSMYTCMYIYIYICKAWLGQRAAATRCALTEHG